MRQLFIASMFAGLFSLSACTCTKVVESRPVRDTLRDACELRVPLPRTTPFDVEQRAREAYLSGYQDGYRSGFASLNILFGKLDERTDSDARKRGWKDGVKAGAKKVAEILAQKWVNDANRESVKSP